MSQSIKTIFVDKTGKQWTVDLLGNGKAVLFEDGFAIFSGTVSQIKTMGLLPKLEVSKNSSKVLTQRVR